MQVQDKTSTIRPVFPDYRYAFYNYDKSNMLEVGLKRKHVDKTLQKKAQALKDIEKRLLQKNIIYEKIPYYMGQK